MKSLEALIETVHRLRAPGGCPWDRSQTHQSLRPYLIEEAYEVLDVLDTIDTDDKVNDPITQKNFREELGDLLMQVLLHSEMASERGAFSIHDVAEALNDKLIRRHPHVFGDQKAKDAQEAVSTWEKQKAKEKSKNLEASILDGVPKGLPSLQKAGRILEKVTRVGFQWDDMKGPLDKAEEEFRELRKEIEKWDQSEAEDKEKAKIRIEDEIGDVMFNLANLALLTGTQPEDALRRTLRKFEKRFRYVERSLKIKGKTPEESDLQEMDRYWDEAKELEKRNKL